MTGRAQVIEFGVFGLCGDLLANSISKIPLESHEHYGLPFNLRRSASV
jgi:hypothetical protein